MATKPDPRANAEPGRRRVSVLLGSFLLNSVPPAQPNSTAASSAPTGCHQVQQTTGACRQYLVLCLLVLSSGFAGGCSSTASQGYADVRVDVRSAIQAATLGPGDEMDIRVYDEPALSGAHMVSPVGQIDFPLIGTITVEGLVASQVGALLRQRLAQGYLKRPFVSVQVKTLTSKKIFVMGEVKAPGRFAFTDNMSIVEAVTMAGGFSPLAERNYTIVTRMDPSGERRIPVPVDKIMQGLAANFLVQPGDIIYVPETIL